ncbi:hypothetical protein ANCCAN_11386 [Ancylostoma caninum]|uniref:Uncharacterized protein n=1 Tax=Ancylostoma caninum TaxID=29170 RepID=A0A368GI21_ANCCA|nr:hypothetical protein ANCCAN_11386 [Ancylostoma caninum]
MFIRTQRSIVKQVITKLDSEIDIVTEIYGKTVELVDKEPYTDTERITILLDKCKGEASRALKFLPRKGSSYNDAEKQLKEQFENKELNVKLLLEQLERIPPFSEDASQLRATVKDIMAVITPLSRSETHIDAREYKT